jgi:hypothetical protein
MKYLRTLHNFPNSQTILLSFTHIPIIYFSKYFRFTLKNQNICKKKLWTIPIEQTKYIFKYGISNIYLHQRDITYVSYITENWVKPIMLKSKYLQWHISNSILSSSHSNSIYHSQIFKLPLFQISFSSFERKILWGNSNKTNKISVPFFGTEMIQHIFHALQKVGHTK